MRKMRKVPAVSIIIPTHNRKEKLMKLLNSILSSKYPQKKLEVIVVDDASTDGTYEEIKRRFPAVKVIRNPKELFLANSRNIGIRNASGKYLFLIDDDGLVTKTTLQRMVNFMEKHPEIGGANPIILLYSTKKVWTIGVKVNMFTTIVSTNKSIPKGNYVEFLSGHCMIFRKEVLDVIGGFNPLFPLEREDLDISIRIKRRGYRLGICKNAIVYHDIAPSKRARPVNRVRAYFRVRSRILFHMLYGRNVLEFIVSLLFSLGISLFDIAKSFLIKDKYLTRNLIKGLLDALTIYLKIRKQSWRY